jgi:hypothetical protein
LAEFVRKTEERREEDTIGQRFAEAAAVLVRELTNQDIPLYGAPYDDDSTRSVGDDVQSNGFVRGCLNGLVLVRVHVTSEMWGLRHHGANYMMFDGVTGAVGTLLVGMAKYLTHAIYNRSILDGQDRVCHDKQCFALTRWIASWRARAWWQRLGWR